MILWWCRLEDRITNPFRLVTSTLIMFDWHVFTTSIFLDINGLLIVRKTLLVNTNMRGWRVKIENVRQTNSTLLPLQHQRKLNQHLNSCQNSSDYILSGFHPHSDYKEREKCPLSITRNQLNEVHNVLSLILRIVTKSESKSPSPAQPSPAPAHC